MLATANSDVDLNDCELPGISVPARCGKYQVYENRTAAAGRKISLRVVVIPATGDERQSDPVVFFNGGPGGSTVSMAQGMVGMRAADLERRDFVFIDYRGTGESNPLFCPYQKERQRGIAAALESFLPVDQIDECYAALSAEADLSQYNTPMIVDDVAEVVQALGYGQVNLWGGSYGTRAVQVFMRRHPQLVRTAVMEGVTPTDARVPVTFAHDAQAALDGWLRECADDPACRQAFPDPAADLATVLKALDAGPKQAQVSDPQSGDPATLALTRNAMVQTLRYMLYNSMSALEIPAYLNAAANDNWQPLAQSAYTVGSFLTGSMPDGIYLSVTCPEDVSRIGPNAVAIQRGFLGAFRLHQQLGACAKWYKQPMPASFYRPVESSIPTLIFSGEHDPVTPARFADGVQEFLVNSRHVIVPHGGHSWFGLQDVECLGALQSQFLDSATLDGLEVDACLNTIQRPPFMLSIPTDEVIELSSDQLQAFSGHYHDDQGGFSIDISVSDNALIATIGEDRLQLRPVTPTRFKVEGMPPGNYVEFPEVDGQQRLHILRSGVIQQELSKGAEDRK
ncbi:MAG: alpha/beta fold hydrolase [Wenzhouxiangellaceae bacterium]